MKNNHLLTLLIKMHQNLNKFLKNKIFTILNVQSVIYLNFFVFIKSFYVFQNLSRLIFWWLFGGGWTRADGGRFLRLRWRRRRWWRRKIRSARRIGR